MENIPYRKGIRALFVPPKVLFIFIVCLIINCINTEFAFATLPQEKKITLKVGNVSIKDAIEVIKEKSNYSFFIDTKDVDVKRKVSVNINDKSVREILDIIFKDQKVKYEVKGMHIIVSTIDSSTNMQTVIPKKISGIIKDETGDPVIGANVAVKGTTYGIISDMNGQFSLEVNENDILQISYIGYTTQEIPVRGKDFFIINISEDSRNLDEVVVVAYGTQKKVNLTGAVSSVKASMLENRTTSNPVNMLTGQVAGVTILQNSGQPGADIGTLRVRGVGTLGNSEAMVIIDGVESSFNNVNPNDIENISVLKDAAASSIYGVRAANGVILVTTKRGAVGKPEITYNGYTGWQAATRMPDYLDSYNFALLYNEAYVNDGLPKPYNDTQLQKFKDGSDPDHYPNSDQIGELLSESGFFHNHHLSLRGGTENIKYSVAMGYHDKDGLTPNTNYHKFNVRSNLDIKINDKLSAGLYLSALRDRYTSPAIGVNNVFYYALRETPVTPIQFQNGNYGLFLNEHNSVASARLGGKDQYYVNGFQGSSFFEYKIIEGLSLKGNAAASFNSNNQHLFEKKIKYYSADSEESIKATRSRAIDFEKKVWEVNLQAYLNYNKTFGKHDVGALLGYSQIYNQYRTFGASRKDLPANNNLGEVNAGDVTTQENEGNMVEYALRSTFGRVNYAFDDRYLFEANLRYDGTSRFPKNNRFGTFPSFSLGWRISEESFYTASSWMESLKLRASWGQLGNQEIGNYAFYNTYVFGQDYSFGNMLLPGVSINDKMGNSIITWEKSDQIDIGVDASLWNGKLSFSGDFFIKNTRDILLQLPIPDLVGVSPPMQNAGEVRNTGFEFQLQHNNKINDFRYFATFNFSYVHNEITDLKEGDTPGRSVGDPIYNIYGFVCEGIFRDQAEIDGHPKQIWGAVPGDLKYKDLTGDGIVNDDDRKSLGTSFPKINYGLNLGFEYKNFDFSTLLQGAGLIDAIVRPEVGKAFYNGGKVTEAHLDRWTPDNLGASYPRLSMKDTQKNWLTSTFWMQNASYLKMRNIQLGYTIRKDILSKTGISKLRLYFSADNLFTITGFDGIDPEVPVSYSGTDPSYYPLTKSYSFGINLSF